MVSRGAGVLLLVWLCVAAPGLRAQTGIWLDRPLQNWNSAGAPLPQGRANGAAADEARVSARMTVRYRVERGPGGAVVVPVDIRTTRSF